MFHKNVFIFVSACLFIALSSCSNHQFREAQHVVAQADSLWHEGKMYGVDMGDSATLAQAYETLGHFPLSWLPLLWRGRGERLGEVSYHYGRLLRAKDDPVAAMRVFIDATHSHTRDYHILGRVYSNMGSICHLAGEFQLSYDMYEKSAEMFLQNGDTLNYYYALNDMAYELAVQGEKDKTYQFLNLISMNCRDRGIAAKILETKAEACLYKQQYDSVIYYSNLLVSYGLNEPTIYLLLAQAYSFMMEYDSASYYAGRIIHQTNELYILNNALYILTNNDTTKDIKSVRETASERADIQKLIEIKRSELSQAVQLLEQDLVRKPDKRWIFTLIAILLFTVTFVFLIHLWKKRKQHRRIIQDIHAKEQLQTQLVHEIDNLSTIQESHQHQIIDDIEETCRLLNGCENIKTQLCWKDYSKMCELVNQRLYGLAELLQSYHFSEKEIRLCVLVMLKASTEDMVNLIPYAKSGLGKFKYTTARKLGTSTAQMRMFLLNMLC